MWMLYALKKKKRSGLRWLHPFSHVALLPRLAGWLLRKAELRPRTHVPVAETLVVALRSIEGRAWRPPPTEAQDPWALLRLTPVTCRWSRHSRLHQDIFTRRSNGACLPADQIRTKTAVSNLLLYSQIYYSRGGGESFLEKKLSSSFFPQALGTTSPLKCLFLTHISYTDLVTRRPRWRQSHFFLTADRTVAPATWFPCLHGAKSLQGRLPLPSRSWHCDTVTQEMRPWFFQALPEDLIVSGNQGNLLRSTFCAPSSNGILISKRFTTRNVYIVTFQPYYPWF